MSNPETDKTGDGGRRTKDGGRRTKDGGRRTKDGGPRTRDGGPRTRDGGRGTSDGGPRTRDGGRRTEDGGRRTRDGGPRTKDGGPRTRDGGPRTKDGGPRTKDGGRRTGERARGTGRGARGPGAGVCGVKDSFVLRPPSSVRPRGEARDEEPAGGAAYFIEECRLAPGCGEARPVDFHYARQVLFGHGGNNQGPVALFRARSGLQVTLRSFEHCEIVSHQSSESRGCHQ